MSDPATVYQKEIPSFAPAGFKHPLARYRSCQMSWCSMAYFTMPAVFLA